jgi:fructosamine-3-kinase
MTTLPNPRQDIYYWKCDRPSAFHGLGAKPGAADLEALVPRLRAALTPRFPGSEISLKPGQGQGNHLTFEGKIAHTRVFVRVEDGSDRDDYMDVESRILRLVREQGVATPVVLASDSSRTEVPFAWQVLEYIDAPDLNRLHKSGDLDPATLATDIGEAVARWQAIRPEGFGPFNAELARADGRLQGFHASYDAYFFARLTEHFSLLVRENFFSQSRAAELREALEKHRPLLAQTQPVLVHKDLALWNILGTPSEVRAYIDWNDAIGGDAMDDISLLACFHDGSFLEHMINAYRRTRPLPSDFRTRFWLHLLRNMITKAVIRAGAGYFRRADNLFLMAAGTHGGDLLKLTQSKVNLAADGLAEDADPTSL